MSGWIKIHRKIMAWGWYTDVPTCHLFKHCVMKANHAPLKWRDVKVDRGQFITGRSKLAAETGLTPQEIRTALKKLSKTGEITTFATKQYTVITVCNYDSYNAQEFESNQQLTNEQPTSNQRATTNKN